MLPYTRRVSALSVTDASPIAAEIVLWNRKRDMTRGRMVFGALEKRIQDQ
jgi:hypothetical protein